MASPQRHPARPSPPDEDTGATLERSIRAGPPPWLVPTVVATATLIAFLPALANAFVDWDDPKNLLENPHYRGLRPANLAWMFTTFYMGHYQPLSWLTLGFDYVVWGMDPFGYHLTSVAIHVANAALVYLLAQRLLQLAAGRRSSPGGRDGATQAAAGFAALLFAVHPLRVESVAWATERRDVLVGFFSLLTILAYLRAAISTSVAERRRLLVASAVLYLCALGSKVIAVTLPAVLVVLDVYPLRRIPMDLRGWWRGDGRRVLAEKMIYLLPAVAASVGAFHAQRQYPAILTLEQYGIAERIAQSLYGLAFYLYKTLVPVALSPLYELRIPMNVVEPRFVVGGAVVAAVTVLAWTARHRVPALAAAWVCYIAVLSPVLGIFQNGPQITADRYTYLSCLGWAILAGGGWRRLWTTTAAAARRWPARPVLAAGTGVVVLALGTLTWRQTQVWRTSETLWRHALAIDPKNIKACTSLWRCLHDQNRHAEALALCEDFLRSSPGIAEVERNAGITLAALNRMPEAAVCLEASVARRPDDAIAQNALAVALVRLGREEDAIRRLEQAIDADPRLPDAYINLGNIRRRQGRLDEAARLYETALAKRPDDGVALRGLAAALVQAGRADEAAARLREALARHPDNASVLAVLASLLASCPDDRIRNGEEAVRLAQAAVDRTRQENAAALAALATAYAETGAFEPAVRTLRLAMRIATARGNLEQMEQFAEMLRHFEANTPFRMPGPPTTPRP